MSTEPSLSAVLERSRSLGLLGPGDVDAHVRHAGGFVELLRHLDHGTTVLDLGSGGGVPGLVLIAILPHLRITLLDASERRVAFLRDAVRQLDAGDRVEVVGGRAEDLARRNDLRAGFDVVVARSFGAPAVTAECAAGFLRVGGRLLVSEPGSSADRWPEPELEQLGLCPGPMYQYPGVTIRELQRDASDRPEVPRRVGVPGRRPLF